MQWRKNLCSGEIWLIYAGDALYLRETPPLENTLPLTAQTGIFSVGKITERRFSIFK